MSNSVSKAIVAGVAALSLTASAFATAEPASAGQWRGGGWHGGGGGWHGAGGGWHGGGWYGGWAGGYGGRHWHPGYWRGGTWYGGGWGPAVATGLLLGAVAAYPYYGAGSDACWQNRPVYSVNGVYLGYQMVDVCQ